MIWMTDDKIPEPFLKGFYDGLADMMILDKLVREYSGRKRINITQSDGLQKDDAVIVLRKSDYDQLIKEYDRLVQMEQDMNNQKVTADTIGDKLVKPLTDSYDDIISGLNDKLDDKDKEINRLKAIYQEYDKQVYSLGFMDILRHKNREISDDFNSKIWMNLDDRVVTDAEVKKLDTDGEPDNTDNGGDAE